MGLFPLDEVELTCQSIEDEEKALLTSSNAIDDTSASKEDEPMKEEKGKPTESSPSTNKEPGSAMAIGEDSKPIEKSFNNVGEIFLAFRVGTYFLKTHLSKITYANSNICSIY